MESGIGKSGHPQSGDPQSFLSLKKIARHGTFRRENPRKFTA